MEIVNFNNLVKQEEYVIFIKPDRDFSINKSYKSLGVGIFDGIYRPGGIFIKLVMTNVEKWDGRRIPEAHYPSSPSDLLLIKNPTTDNEYTEMVRIIESQNSGAPLDQTSIDIRNSLLNGTSPINKFNLHFNEPESIPEAREIPEATQIIDDYECPICLEKITGDAITTKCGHKFHRQCAERIANDKCPLCRAKMRPFSNVGGKSKRKKHCKKTHCKKTHRKKTHRKMNFNKRTRKNKKT